jgi:hypothetical protein
MAHPEAVLRFTSPTKATRLCCDYGTPYGGFVKELLEFVWATPQLNASVLLEAPGKPSCITLRYVYARSHDSLGKISTLFHCKQDTELLRQLHFTHRSEEVAICRWQRYIRTKGRWGGTTGWLGEGFHVYSYCAALADTLLDYRCFLAAPTPEENLWSPPPDSRRVEYGEFRNARP